MKTSAKYQYGDNHPPAHTCRPPSHPGIKIPNPSPRLTPQSSLHDRSSIRSKYAYSALEISCDGLSQSDTSLNPTMEMIERAR